MAGRATSAEQGRPPSWLWRLRFQSRVPHGSYGRDAALQTDVRLRTCSSLEFTLWSGCVGQGRVVPVSIVEVRDSCESGISHGSDGPGATLVPGHSGQGMWADVSWRSVMILGQEPDGSKQGRPGGARIRGFFMPEYKNIKANSLKTEYIIP